jgi:hypothetical protein
MTTSHLLPRAGRVGPAFFLGLLLAAGPAMAGPGAHGPGGEHLDAPATGSAVSTVPRVEAQTELFELVGQLHDSELSLLIDRYDSNEPLLDARVEVESGGLKAVAKFHADHGDYAVDDERLLALLRQSGEHALVFTVVKGADSDLLDGVLRHGVTAAAVTHAADLGLSWPTIVVTLVVLAALAGAAFWFLRRRRAALPLLGGQT